MSNMKSVFKKMISFLRAFLHLSDLFIFIIPCFYKNAKYIVTLPEKY